MLSLKVYCAVEEITTFAGLINVALCLARKARFGKAFHNAQVCDFRHWRASGGKKHGAQESPQIPQQHPRRRARRTRTLGFVRSDGASKTMTLNQHYALQTHWIARNFAFNLDFVPADKWGWKPAPTASSAQEITVHITQTLHQAAQMMAGATTCGAQAQIPHVSAATIESAKTELHEAAETFASQIETLTPDEEQRRINTPYGEFSVAQIVQIDLIDLIHHHGQIAYIQTLLGDTESHFVDGEF